MTQSNRGILKRKGFRRFTAVLMAGVLLAGNLPVYADTEAAEPICGLTEHVHTEACYTALKPASLNCASADAHLQSIHKHTESCYDKEGRLVCGYADFVLHTHADSCYNSQGQLICQIPENKGHQHTDACYADVDVLVCQEAERPAVPGHQHTEACYTWVNTGNLICGQAERAEDPGHIHTEACYTLVNTGNLICGQNERAADPGHTHTEACYTWVNTGNLICGQAERAADPGHSHNEACYDGAGNLICGQAERGADPGHVHTEDCYEHVQQLTCGQEERAADPGHTHTEDCYERVQQLICGQEERVADPGHTHTEDCYEHVQQLSCGQEESAGDPGHVHTASCYQKQRMLICNQPESYMPHIHSDACYEKDENGNLTNTLVCGKAEVYEHIHTEVCIPQTEFVLSCGLEEHQHTEACYPQMVANEVQQETEFPETEAAVSKKETSSETEPFRQSEIEQEVVQEETEYKAQLKQTRAANNEAEQTTATGIRIGCARYGDDVVAHLDLRVGFSESFYAYYEPSRTEAEVNWISTDPDIITVDEEGTVTAISDGTATIFAATKDEAFLTSCDITVFTASEIRLGCSRYGDDTRSYPDLRTGFIESFYAYYEPSGTEAEVDWSSTNENIAAVDEEGTVTAISDGTVTISATTKDGAFTANCELTVYTPTGISLSSSLNMTPGDSSNYSASMIPGHSISFNSYYEPTGNMATADCDWSSSDESVVSVSINAWREAELTANAVGTAVITASTKDGALSATCEITVCAPTGISLDVSSLDVVSGYSTNISAHYEPSGERIIDAIWSSDNENIVSISNVDEWGNAEITANAEGTATITAVTKDGTYSAICEVTVSTPTGITLSSSLNMTPDDSSNYSASMIPGHSTGFSAYYDPTGYWVDADWSSSDESIVSVDENGNVTANAEGTAIITATTKDGALSATCEITVCAPTSISLAASSLILKTGDLSSISAYYEPSGEQIKDATWSSDNESIVSISKIDEWGNVEITANAEGTATITAATKDGAYSATCEVTVFGLTGISLTDSSHTMAIGQILYIYAMNEPTGDWASVDWASSDENIVSVESETDESGIITAKSEGTALITATTRDGLYSATCEITVYAPTGIYISGSEKLTVNSTGSLSAYYEQTDDWVAADWSSSDENIVAVNTGEEGNAWLTAIAEGTAVITATTRDGAYSETFEVTVYTLTGIRLSSSSLNMTSGKSTDICAYYEPAEEWTSDVNWNSSDESIVSVSVDEWGYATITANAEGTAVITATTKDGAYSADCEVTVSGLTGINLNTSFLNMISGHSVGISALSEPAGDIISDVEWSSNDESIVSVSVDEWGNATITANAEGNAVITATTIDGVYSSSCEVAVYELTGISLNSTSLNALTGSSIWLSAFYEPTKETIYDADWSSSDENIVSVKASGYGDPEITAKATGTAVITATTKDGEYSASCEITVCEPTGIHLDRSSLIKIVGGVGYLRAYYEPTDDGAAVDWSSSDDAIASVDEDGCVTAKAVGTAIITATTKDGAFSATCEVTVCNPSGIYVTNRPSEKITAYSLMPGYSGYLYALYEPTGDWADVDWNSSDESIVSVDEYGTLAGITEGTAVITATTKDGEYSASCEVTVSAPTGIKIITQHDVFRLGDSMQCVAVYELASNQVVADVNWSSSDESIVSINKNSSYGRVAELTAKAIGTAVITATTKDGTYTTSYELTVHGTEPVITADPQDVNAAAGAIAEFMVTANGEGLTYQWETLVSEEEGWKTTRLSGYQTETGASSDA